MNENFEELRSKQEKKSEETKERIRPLIEKREQILAKLTPEEREELTDLEDEIRKLTQPSF